MRIVRYKQMSTDKISSFNFRSVKVFDPLKVLQIGVPVLTLAMCVSIWLEGWVPLGLIPIVGVFSIVLNSWSQRMPLCVSVRLHKPTVGDFYHVEGFIFGDVTVGYSVIGQLRSKLKLRKLKYAAGYAVGRKIPLVGFRGGWEARWNHGQVTLYLSEDEIPGALRAVSKGNNLSIEILVGSMRGENTNTMGVKVQSDEGSIESWSSVLGVQTDLVPGPR